MENLEQDSVKHTDASAQKFGRIQNQVASAIRQTADMLSLPREGESGESGKSELSRLGVQTRAWIEGAASQVEKVDPARIKKDLTERIQRSPGTSLMAAAAVGLIFGIVIVRRR